MACADAAARSGAPKASGDLRQFCGRRARAVEITGGQQDLDGGGSILARAALRLRIEENAPDRRGRGVDLALRQTKQRQSRLRLASALVRARVGLFGLGELAAKSMDLAEAVERRARRRPRTSAAHTRPARRAPHHSSCPAAAGLRRDRADTRRDSARDRAASHTIAQARSSTRTRGADRRSPDSPPARCSRHRPPRVGVTSPAITAAIASSSSATPSAMRPRRMSARPRPWQASDARSRSPKRRAISAAWLNVACAADGSPCTMHLNGGGNQQIPAHDAVELPLVEACVRLWRASRMRERWRPVPGEQTRARTPLERPLRGLRDRGRPDARAR